MLFFSNVFLKQILKGYEVIVLKKVGNAYNDRFFY